MSTKLLTSICLTQRATPPKNDALSRVYAGRLLELRRIDFQSVCGPIFASQGDGASEHYHYDLSPNRGLYDLYDEIIKRQCIWQNPTYKVWSSFWSECDQSAVDSCEYIISQSEDGETSGFGSTINREPDALIYPPVDLDRF